MVLRDVALGDRDEAGQPRFRREQVVERARRAVPDRRRRRGGSRSRRCAAGGRRGSRSACRRRAPTPGAASVAQRVGGHGALGASAPRRASSTARHQYAMSLGRDRARPSSIAADASASCVASRPSRDASVAGAAAAPRRAIARATRFDVASIGLPRSPCVARRSRSTTTPRARRSAVSASPSSRCARVCGSLVELEQPLRERDQRAGEVAAVDGGDVARMQRRQRRRVVPVQEVPVVPLEPSSVVSVRSRRRRSVVGREVAEVVRGQRRQQAHADVGRRGAARQRRLVAVSW